MGKERGISPEEVAAIRRGRLEVVDRTLGLDVLLTGRFPDGGMAHTPLGEMADAVGAAIDAMGAQVVIAHDPRGVNAHADHIALPLAQLGRGDERGDGALLGGRGERFSYAQTDSQLDRAYGVGPSAGAPVPDTQTAAEGVPAVAQAAQRAGQDGEAWIVKCVVIDVDAGHALSFLARPER